LIFSVNGGDMKAYKYIVDVDYKGKITLPTIPQIKSSTVEIIILPMQQDDFADLQDASESSIEFWDNLDDEVWNHV
jgi:hypothetical protein